MHSTHTMDIGSLEAHASLRPDFLHGQIVKALQPGVSMTAKELARKLNAGLISVRARLSDGCKTTEHRAATFRKAVRVEEAGSATKVWAFALAEVPAVAT